MRGVSRVLFLFLVSRTELKAMQISFVFYFFVNFFFLSLVLPVREVLDNWIRGDIVQEELLFHYALGVCFARCSSWLISQSLESGRASELLSNCAAKISGPHTGCTL